jgi:8-oxo-dGTP pyrophosphatase MutT (NUDIX family)
MAPDDDQPAARRSSKRRRRRRPRRGAAKASSAPTATGSSTGSKTSVAKNETSGQAEPRARKPRPKERKRRTPTVTEVSAGGVVYRRDADGIEILLAARRTRRGALAWGLAKGGIEDGETAEAAAVREVREETGIDAEIEGSLGETRYTYVWEDVRIRKTVHFFLMRAVGGDPADHDDEMEDVRWFPLERALKRAAYRGERTTLQRAADLLR